MKYPIEFYHYSNDWQLRDAQKKRILNINPEGLDFLQQKETIELCERIVSLLNGIEMVADASKTNGNGSNSHETVVDEVLAKVPKKRGRPPKVK